MAATKRVKTGPRMRNGKTAAAVTLTMRSPAKDPSHPGAGVKFTFWARWRASGTPLPAPINTAGVTSARHPTSSGHVKISWQGGGDSDGGNDDDDDRTKDDGVDVDVVVPVVVPVPFLGSVGSGDLWPSSVVVRAVYMSIAMVTARVVAAVMVGKTADPTR